MPISTCGSREPSSIGGGTGSDSGGNVVATLTGVAHVEVVVDVDVDVDVDVGTDVVDLMDVVADVATDRASSCCDVVLA